MNQIVIFTLMLANAIWLGLAFRLFWLKAYGATRLLVRQGDRDSEAYRIMAQALPFLGGMNLALSVLAILVLVFFEHFQSLAHAVVLCTVFAVAHLSQFMGNLPVALAERRTGESLWPVLRGPMLFIFVVDLGLGLVNLGVALFALSAL